LGEEAQVICLIYEKRGQSRPGKTGHCRPAEEARVANPSDNAPFDVTARRRTYMRAYMRRWRARSRAGQAPELPKKQPQVEENPARETPPFKGRKPPPIGEREARWAARAEEMETLAENMLMDEPHAMMERLAQDYERMSEREQ
jgi:hypothetical protein